MVVGGCVMVVCIGCVVLYDGVMCCEIVECGFFVSFIWNWFLC